MSKREQNPAGLVVASFGNRGHIDIGDGATHRYVHKGRRLRTVCGDQVDWEWQKNSHELLVTGIRERSNLLERPGTRAQPEPIAANLSRLVIVLAAEPEPDFFIADRYICAAELLPSEVLILWNKTDLSRSEPAAIAEYRSLGYELLETSTANKQGISDLAKILATGISMLVGQSGVGKSSLINQLVPTADVATSELSTASREGKHTTTASIMHNLPAGGRLIDSPGVREFTPVIRETARVQAGFREILATAIDCKFSNCEHLREPNCAVKMAVDSGEIGARRYESYKRQRQMALSLKTPGYK
jgi:ribosome biogenesis GTPase